MKPARIVSGLILAGLAMNPASADSTQSFCVKCNGPDKTYLCDVDVPNGMATDNALQLYCVINVAKDRGHEACSAKKAQSDQCNGPVVSYSYAGPSISTKPTIAETPAARENPVPPSELSETTPPVRENPVPPSELSDGPQPIGPPQNRPSAAGKQKSHEPETMVDLTNEAVDASGRQIKKAGKAVKKAGSKTGEVVTDAAKNAGSAVGTAAKSVGNVAVKTGKAVGKAATGAFKCIASLFQDC